MNIALIGATGFIGSALLQEALQRGHKVTALVRDTSKLPAHANLTAIAADVNDVAALASALKGNDAVISALSGHAQGNDTMRAYFVAGYHSILTAIKTAGIKRILVVGGAGSLEIAPGVQLVDTPNFPDAYKQSALGARDVLNLLREETTLDWTLLSPAAMIKPGPRTGQFRLGSDQLVTDAQGNSEISVADYAVAMLDEAEQGKHIQRRFTLAY
ncbi:NAD(P)-dependent oxidoreductase [Silvimonas amylolytica]|uniref:NAD(P)-binding domain-containing protein n=1 Tax=Silvimonas amylolytica TaxID=449663 RepID=A0ABQ2PI59_9NEIS|nr:NAD(P)-dependent oxidoreductase [Silvimonas amylolytica]GGP24659.1 hypothetical protein GCM10010971_04780 [Silvimonas amylolytica]